MELKDPELLTNDEISDLLPDLDGIIAWAKQIKEYAITRALNGEDFSGYKLVEGRSDRKITNEDGLVAALKKAGYEDALIYERRLSTLSTLERIVGKKRFAELSTGFIEKPQGKPTLVPEDDKRSTYTPANCTDKAFDDGYTT